MGFHLIYFNFIISNANMLILAHSCLAVNNSMHLYVHQCVSGNILYLEGLSGILMHMPWFSWKHSCFPKNASFKIFNSALNKSLEQWIQAPITFVKPCIYNAISSVLNKLLFIWENMSMSFLAALYRHSGKIFWQYRHSIGKVTFSIKCILLILLFPSVLLL